MMLSVANIRELPIADNSIDLIFTDPPYASKSTYLYEWLAHEAKRILRVGGFVLAMAGSIKLNELYRMFDDSGLTYHIELGQISSNDAPILWPKKCLTKHKPILCYSNGPGQPRTMVMNIFDSRNFDKSYHHWGQDVESARYYVDCFSGPGDVVLDPFIGGGTTAVACGLIGRRCIGFDIDAAAIETTRARLLEAEIPVQVLMNL